MGNMYSPAGLQQGTSVGPYVIVEPLAAGGMGQVYRARDPRLGREVAIKVLAAAPDADRLARFEREARATAILAHPNIVTVFDIGLQDGLPFLVSELLEGETGRVQEKLTPCAGSHWSASALGSRARAPCGALARPWSTPAVAPGRARPAGPMSAVVKAVFSCPQIAGLRG
jgi:hypothetical protein